MLGQRITTGEFSIHSLRGTNHDAIGKSGVDHRRLQAAAYDGCLRRAPDFSYQLSQGHTRGRIVPTYATSQRVDDSPLRLMHNRGWQILKTPIRSLTGESLRNRQPVSNLGAPGLDNDFATLVHCSSVTLTSLDEGKSMEQRVVGFIERLRRLAVGGPLMILVALVLSSCGTQQQARATTLRMMVGAEPPHLNRIVLTSATIDPVVLNVMEPLVDLDKQGQPVGKLATKWEPSADLSRWRFTLRQGVKFQNGDTFSVHDVVDTVKWVIDESKASFVYSRLPMKD